MSNKGVDNTNRRKWDKEEYARLAEEREAGGGSTQRKVVVNPVERTALKRREGALGLDDNLGKTQVVNALAGAQGQGGYYCDVCDCAIKDSQAWLDHINGKKHNRNLGMNMRAERASVDSVKRKLEALRQAKTGIVEESFEQKLERLRREEEEARKEKKKRKKAKKEEQRKNETEGMEKSEEVEEEVPRHHHHSSSRGGREEGRDSRSETADANEGEEEMTEEEKMMMMMGLPVGGFTSSKK